MTLGNLIRVLQIALDLYGNDVEVETLVVPPPYQDGGISLRVISPEGSPTPQEEPTTP